MTIALFAAAFAAGTALGAAHFGSLWWSVVLMRDGRTALGVATQALRFVVLAAALAMAARLGAVPFVAAALGVLSARAALTRHHTRRLV